MRLKLKTKKCLDVRNVRKYIYIKDSDTDLVNVVDATKRVYCDTKRPQLLGPPPYFLIGRLPFYTVM